MQILALPYTSFMTLSKFLKLTTPVSSITKTHNNTHLIVLPKVEKIHEKHLAQCLSKQVSLSQGISDGSLWGQELHSLNHISQWESPGDI